MMGGIESLLKNKVDAHRANPGALQQSYQQNQQLLDLLALQKLKSEKEAAKRDMLLKAQQTGTPPTIAQTREAEMLDANRQELATQVGGAGQNMVNQQQQAMQQLLSGVAGLPAQNMTGMAQGGIVGYAGGGNVAREDVRDEIIGYDGEGYPIRASDFARVAHGDAVDDTEEGRARRAAYAALQGKGEQGRADLRSAASGPTVEINTGEGSPRREGNYGLDELAIDGWNLAKRGASAAREGIASLAGSIPGMSDQEIADWTTPQGTLTRRTVASAPTPAAPVVSPAPRRTMAQNPGPGEEGFMGPAGTPQEYLRLMAQQSGGVGALPEAGQDDYSKLMARRQAQLDRTEDPAMRRRKVLAAALLGGGSGYSIADSLAGMGRGANAEGQRIDADVLAQIDALAAPLHEDITATRDQGFEMAQIGAETAGRLKGVEMQVLGRLAENAQALAADTGLSPSLINDIVSEVEAAVNDPMQANAMRERFMAEKGVRERDMDDPEQVRAYAQWLDEKIQQGINNRLQRVTGGGQQMIDDPEVDELVSMYGS